MVFFDVSEDSDSGQGSLKLSRHGWLYPATAVPLTVVVIVIWVIWRRFRLQRKRRDIEAGMSVEGKEKNA